MKFRHILCPITGKKGKPDPFLLNRLLKTSKKEKTHTIGDTYTDYKFAKNSELTLFFVNMVMGKLASKT